MCNYIRYVRPKPAAKGSVHGPLSGKGTSLLEAAFQSCMLSFCVLPVSLFSSRLLCNIPFFSVGRRSKIRDVPLFFSITIDRYMSVENAVFSVYTDCRFIPASESSIFLFSIIFYLLLQELFVFTISKLGSVYNCFLAYLVFSLEHANPLYIVDGGPFPPFLFVIFIVIAYIVLGKNYFDSSCSSFMSFKK